MAVGVEWHDGSKQRRGKQKKNGERKGGRGGLSGLARGEEKDWRRVPKQRMYRPLDLEVKLCTYVCSGGTKRWRIHPSANADLLLCFLACLHTTAEARSGRLS